MQKLISYFFSDFNLKRQTLYFKRLLYSFVILKCIYWLCYYDLLFGKNSIIFSKPYPINGLQDLAYLLYSQTSNSAAFYFIIPALVLGSLNLFIPRLYFVTDLILWFLVVNIHTALYSSLTGGDYLLNQLLFFNCLLTMHYTTAAKWTNDLKRLLHNLGVAAIIVQVSLVYVLSAITKLGDADWLSGKAITVISEVKHYSLYSLPAIPAFLSMIVSYLVITYQLTFPVLICLRPVKKPLIILGILMHLYIALVMGLVSFGITMLIAYVYFWPMQRPVSTTAQRN